MKNTFYFRASYLFLLCNLSGIILTKAQCVNSGIGTNSPTSKLHIVGCGNTSATSSLNVADLNNGSLLFVRDDGKVGLGTSTPEDRLHIGVGISKMVIGSAYAANLGYGTSYIGFNAGRSATGGTWATDGDGANNGGSIIYGDVAGNIKFTTITSIGGTAHTGITDATIAAVIRFFISNNGNVGVGTITPAYKLETIGDVAANTGGLISTYPSNEGGRVVLINNNKSTATTMRVYTQYNMTGAYGDKLSTWAYNGTGTTSAERFSIWDNGDFSFHNTGGVSMVKFANSGNVGIGTALISPSYRLHVTGTGTFGELASFQNGTSETFVVTNAAGAQVYNYLTKVADNGIFWKDDATVESANGFVIAPWAGSAKGIRIDGPTGNLGVGVASPGYKIEAAGDIYANQGALMCSKNSSEGGAISNYNHTKTTAGQNMIYIQYNMTGGYGNKYSIWGYPQVGVGAERFSIWDNGDFSFHNTAGVSKIKFTNNGNLSINNATPTEIFQIGTTIAIHDGGDKLLAFGYAPTPNTDLDATKFAGELRFNPTIGAISLATSATITSLPLTRFFIDKDGSTGIGTALPSTLLHLKDGHIRSEQTTAPAIAVSITNGITAAALATGSTDTKGSVTTTGDNTGTNTVITVTFNKVCSVTPVVVITPANASAQAYTYFVTAGTTSFTINFKDAGTNATPSFNYIVLE